MHREGGALALSATYTVILRKEPEGGFTVLVPALPGVVSYGRDLAHARYMARDAIGLFVETLADDGEPVPVEDGDAVLVVPPEELGDEITIIRVTVALPKHAQTVGVRQEPSATPGSLPEDYMPGGTAMSIFRQAGISEEEALRLLEDDEEDEEDD